MRGGQLGAAGEQVRRLFGAGTVAVCDEWQLLHRYLDRRDEVAFEAIVMRHGPMVRGVCRRVLGDSPDVDDAFQATFLILARKGSTLGEYDPVGHWLHGVAYRVALRARSAAARRRSRERSVAPLGISPDADESARRELGAVVQEELARLPSKYRAPVVLCYLEGLTHEEAGRQLGWPVGTIKGRLSRARDILKGRLTRRGVASAVATAAISGVPDAGAAVPAALLRSTMQAAMAGRAAGMVPAAVAALMAGSLTTMFLHKMKTLGAILLLLGTGGVILAYQGSGGPGGRPKPAQSGEGPVYPAPAYPAKIVSQAPPSSVSEPSVTWMTPPFDAPDESPKSKAILAKLDERISMNFPNDTPLEDVKKYIEQSTQDKAAGLPVGIPIYVDPQGLQDADKTMASTVAISLKGVALKTTLTLLLKQLNLGYQVKDGLLIIQSLNPEDQETPITILRGKSERGELTRDGYKQLIEMLKLRNEVRQLGAEVIRPQ